MTEHETFWHRAADRDDFETSLGFTALPLLSQVHRAETLEEGYRRLWRYRQTRTDEMRRLQDKSTPRLLIGEIPFVCNSAYRYRAHLSEAPGEVHLRADKIMALITNAPDLTAAEAVTRYKGLADIERGFRVLKSDIEIALVHHRLPDRIRAHAMICFLVSTASCARA